MCNLNDYIIKIQIFKMERNMGNKATWEAEEAGKAALHKWKHLAWDDQTRTYPPEVQWNEQELYT